jgi:DNA-binding IclR family transcriptional regulator
MQTKIKTSETPARRARGLDRAFDILDYLRERKSPARPNQIAVGISAPRSTVYELISALIEAGLLEQTDSEGRVFLGRKLYFLGLAYEANFDLTRECRAYLDRLAVETRETAQLCMLDGNKYTVAMMREGVRPFHISSNVGEPVPVPWTASGRLLVSHMTDEEILDFIPAEDFVLPTGATLNPRTFIAEVRQAAKAGFFSFDTLADNFTRCFAAPVRDHGGRCVATLCLIAPRKDAKQHFEQYKAALLDAATDLSTKLTSRPLPSSRTMSF